MKLYELTSGYLKLWDMVENEEVDLQMVEDTLQSVEGDIQDKAESMVKILKSVDANVKGLKDEEERLNKKRKSFENKYESIKKYLEYNLITMGIDKLQTSIATVSIANNPPSVDIFNEELVPDVYKIPQPAKIDRKSILEDLKLGVVVDGAGIKQGKSIRIR